MNNSGCRWEGLCPDCSVARYRGAGARCYNCGSTNPERKTLGKICAEQCDICRVIDIGQKEREART